jgi:hypothetical protein
METYVIAHGAINEDSGYIVLSDFKYWLDKETDLREWCDKNLSLGSKAFVGSIIEFTNEEELVLFMLRWS